MQNASQEHVLKIVLCEKRVPGVAAYGKQQQEVSLMLGQTDLPNKDFAEALQEAKIDLLSCLQYSPTCISQNFICYYTVEACLIHNESPLGGQKSKGEINEDNKPAMVEFELFFNNSEMLTSLFEQVHTK